MLQTHLEIQQREDIRRDLAERMKFVPPDLRAGEHVFYWQEDPSKIQQGRKSGKWLKLEIIAVKGSMAVVNTGATIFQANISKLRRPMDTVDLEELTESRERTGAPVLWLSCEGQIDVWEMFSDNSYLSAILDRQGLLVATPIDLRTKKSSTVETKDFKKEEVYGCGRTSNSWRKTLPYVRTRIRKDLVVEKGATSTEKVPLPMDPRAWRKTQVEIFTTSAIVCVHWI